MVLQRHKGDTFIIWVSRFTSVLAITSWGVSGRNGLDNGFSSLMLWDLTCVVVSVCSCVEPFDSTTLQFTLGVLSWLTTRKYGARRMTYNLHVIIVCCSNSSDCFRIISKGVIFVSCKIESFTCRSWGHLALGSTTVCFCCQSCCASSSRRSFFWEL